jgi:hypothetical protein
VNWILLARECPAAGPLTTITYLGDGIYRQLYSIAVNIIVYSSGYRHHLLYCGCVAVHGNVAKAVLMSCMNVALHYAVLHVHPPFGFHERWKFFG